MRFSLAGALGHSKEQGKGAIDADQDLALEHADVVSNLLSGDGDDLVMPLPGIAGTFEQPHRRGVLGQ